MVTPNQLSHRMNRLFLGSIPANVTGYGTSLGCVQPAIWSPAETIRDRVRVFDTETFKMNDGISIRNVVMVFVGIEQKVGRIEYPQPIAIEFDRCRQTQSFDERLMLIKSAIAIGV